MTKRPASFRTLMLFALVSGAWSRAYAQQPDGPEIRSPQFEVASVKPRQNHAPVNAIDLNFLLYAATGARDGRFSIQNAPLTVLFELAYDVSAIRTIGWPSWADSDRYDIDARAAYAATFEEMRPMLKSLLAERFHLQVHQQLRTMPLYELIVAKRAHKLQPSNCIAQDPTVPAPPVRFAPPPLRECGGVRRMTTTSSSERINRIEAKGISIPQLIGIISDDLSRPVIDKTGYPGMIDVQLEFTPTEAITNDGGSTLSLFSALSRELGLRLIAVKGPVDIFVIDRAEKALEN